MSFVFRGLDGKYGDTVLQHLGPFTELESSVPSGQKGVPGWFSEEPEDCSKDGFLATRYPQKRFSKSIRSLNWVHPDVGDQAEVSMLMPPSFT